ncbi:nucleocapsid protein [Actinidia cytorhabdovirus JS27]|uniref:Nucleoprotein n=1 Tax=Actinidia virus D TaxID=3069721 RepID=A0A8E6YJ20_9RHAB|nr:nucleocapsid protein [Actinidia cytorhabdovirus JS27]QVU21443.1 nucleocapsid protein [Actinidia virus D]
MAEFTTEEINAMKLLFNAEKDRKQKDTQASTSTKKEGQILPPPHRQEKKKEPIPEKKRNPGFKNPFADLADVTVSLTNAPKVWSDNDIKNIQIVGVEQLNVTDMIAAGEDMMASINNEKITSSTIDTIVSLACSILVPGSNANSAVYALTPLPSTIGLKLKTIELELRSRASDEADKLRAKISRAQRMQERATNEDEKTKAAELEARLQAQMDAIGDNDGEDDMKQKEDAFAYSYLAAYIMRLPGKTPDVWADKLSVAKTRFNTWYDCDDSALDSIEIGSDAAEKIREGLARRPDALATWLLWVAYNENENNKMTPVTVGLMRYLACQMYSYTGMHAYSSIMTLSVDHNMTFDVLLRELLCPATQKALYEVANIIRKYELTEKSNGRKTYFRYAKNWDSGYFINLQSKNCTILGYTVAKARKMLSSTSNMADPTQAFAFRNMDEKLKQSLDKVADKLYDLIMSRATQDETSGIIWYTD